VAVALTASRLRNPPAPAPREQQQTSASAVPLRLRASAPAADWLDTALWSQQALPSIAPAPTLGRAEADAVAELLRRRGETGLEDETPAPPEPQAAEESAEAGAELEAAQEAAQEAAAQRRLRRMGRPGFKEVHRRETS